MGWTKFFSNVAFWAFVLAMKMAFDWFALMKQMEAAIRGLWDFGWLNG
jgi:hypothetical protein